MKNCVFWDVAPGGSCNNRCFVGSDATIFRVEKIRERKNARRLLTYVTFIEVTDSLQRRNTVLFSHEAPLPHNFIAKFTF
jgi:hypothetical protein